MLLMVDLDGTITAAPQQCCAIMSDLHDKSWHVTVVSGDEHSVPIQESWTKKAATLKGLGLTDCWDELVVVTGDIPSMKAQWAAKNRPDIAIDNDKKNAKALTKQGVPLVLVPWGSRV